MPFIKYFALCNECGKWNYCIGLTPMCPTCYRKVLKREDPNRVKNHNESNKKYRDEVINEIYSILGNQCVCCGESEKLYLQIDHINGGGLEHRKKMKNNTTYLKSILNDPDIKLKYRLLCANCHQAITRVGYCPHHPEDKYEPVSD